ncbi:hypothetical protein, partial [Rhabdothermincola sp.]|uniref:hypothetical protein n=1 Tax=Rhabdothermincola sp. TaxID=2820405 RepID=UPI002FE0B22B
MVNPLNLFRSDGPTHRRRDRLGLGALLVAAAALLGLLPLATASAATTPIRYGWNGGLQGWVGENSQVSVDKATKYEGAGALAGTRSVTGSWNTLRLNSPVFSPTDLRISGTELSTYVYLPVGTPGRWSARLNVQSPSWAWTFGPAAPVTPGQWTRVTFTVPAPAAASVHRVGVQFEVTGASGMVRALVDSFRQVGTGSGTTTTTKAPTSTTSTTQAPTTTTAVTSTTTAPPTTT